MESSVANLQAASHPWFSEDPNRAWAEKFFLTYSPVWMAIIAAMMLTGFFRTFGNVGWLSLGLVVALPPVILPRFIAPTAEARTYALKFNLWIWIFAFAGNYFFTRYVTDLFGLQYTVNTVINFAAVGVGKHQVPVPFVMFLLTQAYFLTYHTLIFLGFRRSGQLWPVMIVLAFGMAFGETAAMASPLIADMFSYADKTRMLIVGTLCYGSGFVISAPLLWRMQPNWPWSRVILEAMAASMLQFYAYEAWSWIL